MSASVRDLCVSCSKIIKNCHKNISCKICKGYVHKKCTKLKRKELARMDSNEWMCHKCKNDTSNIPLSDDNGSDIDESINVREVDFEKYDNMIFNPLRYQHTSKELNDEIQDTYQSPQCSYITPDQFNTLFPSTDDNFSILNVNIRSLSKNFDKLRECMKSVDHDFSIIAVSETHLKQKPHEYFDIPGYKIEYMNRTGRDKGGVCMYISNKLKYKLRTDLCKANSNFESCFVEIENNNQKNIIAGTIYRAHTPIDNFVTDIDPIFQKIIAEKKINYVMGDFNIDLLKDDIHRPTHDYLDLIYSYSLIPTIFKPTRITETSATIIDNILTNNENTVNSAILVTDISDHLPTIITTDFKMKSKVTKHNYFYKRMHSNSNIEKLKESLSKVNWQSTLDNNDANDDYNKFTKTFTDIYDECIPLKKCTRNNRKEPRSPWITKCLLNSIRKKNKLYKEYLSCPNENRMQKFKTYRNKLHSLIRKAKRQYFFNKFEHSKNNMRQTWKTINHIIGRGKNKTPQSKFKTDNGENILNPQEISNEFNNFFVNIGPKLASNISNIGKDYHDYLHNPLQSSMFMKPIVEIEVNKIIDKFNQNKSSGHDNIGNFIVKRVASEIVKPLTMIFNLSISTGVVPDNLKIAKVVPIYKKGDAELLSNYRPVSVLPCFSKILERLVFNRCMSYIDKQNILNEKQFGFRKNHSTYMAIIELVDKINNAVEKNETTMGIFLDLSKAFDTIDHNILLYKLDYYGFRGIVHNWFENYLSNRKQFVYYNSSKSDLKNIVCGVPQGSILGPLLFILYINDIVNTSEMLEFVLFADDTTILYSHVDIVSQTHLINKELLEVSNWFRANKLSVNAPKTNCMVLGTPHMTSKYANESNTMNNDLQTVKIVLDNTELERVNKTKFLGVLIDENLTWKHHIDGISKTISRNIGIINKLKLFVPERVLHSLYCTLILPYVNYGILIWGNTSKMYLDKVLKLQKWAIRTISNSHYRSHTGPLFSRFNILNVFDTFRLELGVFMYKYNTNKLPICFDGYFVKRTDIHDYHTRNANDYCLTKNRKVFSDQSVRTFGPILWNSLHQNMKLSKSIKHFRNQFKNQLISTYE